MMFILRLLPRSGENVPKDGVFDYNGVMIWLRKGFVHFLAFLLLLSLVGGVAALDVNRNLAPAKLENSLASSNIYDQVTASALQQAEKSSSDGGNPGSISLSDPLVKQAAKNVFSPALIQQSVNTFINNNSDWLAGKKPAPDFRIDLTSAKRDFAKQVGYAAQAHLASLPVCSAQQLSQLTIPVDVLSVTCRPPTLDPKTEANQVAQEVNDSSDFLSNPVITAASLNQNQLGQSNSTSQGQPYYQKLSWAPKVYQIGLKLPWILGLVALLSALGIVFIAPSRRRGARRIGAVLLVAGLILIFIKAVADASVNKFASLSVKGALGGDFKQPISDFLRKLEPQMVRSYLPFGIVFIAAAVVIFVVLFRSRQRTDKPGSPKRDTDAGGSRTDADSLRLAPRRSSSTDTGTTDLKPGSPPLKPLTPIGKKPPRTKPPRLIQ